MSLRDLYRALPDPPPLVVHLLRIEWDHAERGFRASCSCGWSAKPSASYSTAARLSRQHRRATGGAPPERPPVH